jgi:antitoxin MazE
MAEVVLDIEQWGSYLGICLPAAVAREARLHVGQPVCISVEVDRVVITPVENSRVTLEQRVAAYDAKRHGGERMARTKTLRAERW